MAADGRKVLVIGLDGLDPGIAGALLDAGELPHLAALRSTGGLGTVQTTYPAQTPVAWSSFATGTNPGGHGIYDFVRRDPATYLPDLGLNRYEQKSAFLPPKVVNLRRGRAVWEVLTDAGISSVVLRCPCTYPPDKLRGRMLSGMGVPDIRGGLGTGTFYTSVPGVRAGESENVVAVERRDDQGIRSHLIGPRNPKSGDDARLEFQVEVRDGAATIRLAGRAAPTELALGQWSEWVKVKFKLGMLQTVHGMLRFYLRGLEPFELYASPINFDPVTPMFPISQPWEYAAELEKQVGTFYTTGMVEDHTGLNNGRFDEEAYLAQCAQVLDEREAMLHHELDRFDEGFLYCLFDTPDRIQHMFWRFQDAGHPANRGEPPPEDLRRAIADHYKVCDAIVGRMLERVDDRTFVIVLSDHGFGTFQRGVHLNGWLHHQGFLHLQPGHSAGEDGGDLLRHVDWGRTKAYALGLGSIYLNRRGREASGVVTDDDAPATVRAIVQGLSGLADPERGAKAVRSVAARDEIYSGPYVDEAPDLLVNFAPGYRVSWGTALGEVPRGWFEDNTKRWSGDHIVDPPLVPGILLMNRPFRESGARIIDLAPTILDAFGLEKPGAMEGSSLIA